MRINKLFIALLVCLQAVAMAKPIINIKTWQDVATKVPVWLVSRHDLPMVDIAVVYAAGSILDGKQPGLASLTNTVVISSIKGMSTQEFDNQLKDSGSIIDSEVDVDKAVIKFRAVVGDSFNKAWPLFLRIISAPSFAPDKVNLAKNRLQLTIKSAAENPLQIAKQELFKALYVNHPYANFPTIETVVQISRDNLVDFFTNNYTRDNAKIVIVGDVDIVTATKLAAELAQRINVNSRGLQVDNKLPIAKQDKADINIHFNSKQSTIMLGQLAVKRDADDLPLLQLGNHILGGGMGSFLFDEIREKRGWSYFIHSYFLPYKFSGSFLIVTQTQNKDIASVIKTIKDTLHDFMQANISASQLQRAKAQFLGNLYTAISSNKGLLDMLINLAYYEKPSDYLDTFVAKVKVANVASINKAFAKVMVKPQVVVVGPKV